MMSLNQVRKTFHRHLLLDSYPYYLLSSPSHSSPFHSDFSLHPSSSSYLSSRDSTDSLNSLSSNDSGSTGIISDYSKNNSSSSSSSSSSIPCLGSSMDIMDLSDHHCRILKATLEVNKQQQQPHQQQHQLRQQSRLLKNKSPVIESLKYKAAAAALSTPSLSSTSLAATSSTSTSTSTATATTPTRSILKSKMQIANLSTSSSSAFTRTKRVPYYAASFSPLDLPSEIFLYLLEFLSPADLWRLCQVSRTMHVQVMGFMSHIQTFKYGAVRILHQEHLSESASYPSISEDASSTTTTVTRSRQGSQPTLYEQMTATACSPRITSLSRAAAEAKGSIGPVIHSRSSYWLAQARFLVAMIMEGTAYEPKSESVHSSAKASAGNYSDNNGGSGSGSNNSSSTIRLDHITADVTPSTQAPLHDYAANSQQYQQQQQQQQQEQEAGVESNLAAHTTEQQQQQQGLGIGTTTTPSIIALVTGPLPPSTSFLVTPTPTSVPSFSSLAEVTNAQASFVGLNAQGKFKGPPPGSLPEGRLQAMVELLFDPSLVHLTYRRAIINCARYVSASIDETSMRAFGTQDPFNPDFHVTFQDRCQVQMGPFLTMYSPVLYDDDGLELTAQEQALIGRASSKIVEPPRKLHNFQILLWHRCLSDLIALYNRIQNRHLPEALPSSSRPGKPKKSLCSTSFPVCCQDPPRRASRREGGTSSLCQDFYPMCCHAHSLVFTTEYSSFNLIPYPLRVHFRRIVQRVQSASQHSLWSVSTFGRPSQGLLTRRVIEYTGPKDRLRFCSGSVHPPNYLKHSSSSTPSSSSWDWDDNNSSSNSKHLRRREQETDALMLQRLRIEESIRQDTLMKQELLALCHMACGLFLTEERALDTPPTIMSLLRQGGPWSKGVWQEGEWRHSAIDPSSSLASPSSSSSSRSKGRKSASSMTASSHDNAFGIKDDYAMDQGRWQRICVATIQFLAHEDLTWGGNRTNAELSRLRTTSNATSWIYHE